MFSDLNLIKVMSKRIFRYLLRRYFGQYLEDFSDEVLTWNGLSQGIGSVENLHLNVEALNLLGDEYSLPLEFLAGTIEHVCLTVPLNAFFSESIVVELKGLHLTVRPLRRAHDVSMFESVYESMSSTIEMAEECIKEEDFESESEAPSKGVEKIAKAIEAVLYNLKIKLCDLNLKIQYMNNDGTLGTAVEIRIDKADYFDEAGSQNSEQKTVQEAYSTKKIIFEGVTLHAGEFSPDKQVDPHLAGSPDMPATHSTLPSKMDPEVPYQPILIARFFGRQEFAFQIKQTVACTGPKINVKFNLANVNFFLTPQQVHMLQEILDGFFQPDTSANCKNFLTTNKPMQPGDYAVCEQDMFQRQHKAEVANKSLRNPQGWSSPALDESDDFLPMTTENKFSMVDSLCSSIGNDSQASSHFRASKPRGGSTVQGASTNQLSDLTNIEGSISSCSIVILHDDCALTETVKAAKCRATTYFEDLLKLHMQGADFTDFDTLRGQISPICPTNHLRFVASTLKLGCSEQSSSMEYIISYVITVLRMELLECLGQPQICTKLFTCDKETVDDSNLRVKEACFRLKYQQWEYTSQSVCVLSKPPANKLDLRFGPVHCLLDISLSDRIQTLLGYCQANAKSSLYKDADFLFSRCSSRTEITASSPYVVLTLKFPVPDLRPAAARLPWWQQNLRPESLIFELIDATLITASDSDATDIKYEIQCRDLHGLLKQSDEGDATSFLRVAVDPNVDEASKNKGFDWPRLVINKTGKVLNSDLNSEYTEEVCAMSYQSLSDNIMNPVDTSPTPFRKSPLAYGSKLEKNSSSLVPNEVVKPNSKESMGFFIEQTSNKSEWELDFKLPTVHMVLPDRDFFELLLNRLSNDLLLWKPTALVPKSGFDPTRFRVHIPGLDQQSTYKKFTSFHNESDSSEEEEEEAPMCSIYDWCKKRQICKKDGFTFITTTIAITKGRLLVHTPLEEANMCGKLQLDIEEGCLFFASSYNGDPNESYFCIMAEKSTLFHNGCSTQNSLPSVVQPISEVGKCSDRGLSRIIYASDHGMLLDHSCGDDMLRIAVHSVINTKQQLKTFKVAIEISDATLRHFTLPVDQMWVNQLIEFMKTQTNTIEGHVPFAVITELHINLSHSAVDYRPLNLPLRSALTVDNFNMSCNISATTPSFLFRIISEEMRLFLSTNTIAEKVDLKKNYVCVIDTGLIDVSFKTTVSNGCKRLELCATNNIVHMRTCSDSFKSLMDFFVYLSVNGDDPRPPPANETEENVSLDSEVSEPDSDADSVNRKMAEAMKNCPRVELNVEKSSTSNSPSETINPDDEFVILGDDVGTGLKPRDGEPIIRLLTNKPIVIVDDYFSVPPPGKQDAMKAPSHYPQPIVCLELREMSLVWHVYGGSDFSKPDNGKKSKYKDTNVSFADDRNVQMEGTRVSFSKAGEFSNSHCPQEHIPAESWLHKGGPLRDHNVLMELHMNKIKFRREQYSSEGEYASRYVLLIYDIEIRDRLKCSEINKFLYQYSSEKMPRQTSADMFGIKGVYTRPDPRGESEECSMKVTCKPLRLNVDQDSLEFLANFFREVTGVNSEEKQEEAEIKEKNTTNLIHHLPLKKQKTQPTETFYKYFCFSPDLLIRIDYQPKRVSLEKGVLEGILFGLTNLNASEIRLRRLCYRNGLLGHGRLLQYAVDEWHQDILKTQLPSILVGVGPMSTFVKLFGGLRDLLMLPVEQYRRDGQIVRGLQRGASSFSTSALVATLDVFSAVVNTIQHAAIMSYDLVSPGPSVCQDAHRSSAQPADIREGLTSALSVVKEGFEDTARTICTAATLEHEHKGVRGAVGGVLRQLPPTLILRPIIVTSEATSYLLDGVRHQLMPDAHQEDLHKWRSK